MSSLRNAVKRSTHKERAQPSSRHRFGILEKKKDYLQRARNHQQKEQTLKVLREKAENRNPDEYYTAMQHGPQRAANPDAGKLTDAQIKGLKSQDLRHVQLQSRKRRKDLQRLQESLHFIGAPAARTHTVFVDAAAALESSAAEQDLGSQVQNSAAALDGTGNGAAVPDRAAARRAKRRASAYRQLLEAREEAGRVEEMAARLRAAKVAASRGRRTKQPAGGESNPTAAPRFKRVRQG